MFFCLTDHFNTWTSSKHHSSMLICNGITVQDNTGTFLLRQHDPSCNWENRTVCCWRQVSWKSRWTQKSILQIPQHWPVPWTKTVTSEVINSKIKSTRLQSSNQQNLLHYFLYNRLMDYWHNRSVVEKQRENLQKSAKPGETVVRDMFHRFIYTGS